MEKLQFLQREADEFSAPRLEGANLWESLSSQGKLIIEELNFPTFSIQALHFDFENELLLNCIPPLDHHIYWTVLRDEIKFSFEQLTTIKLTKHQYILSPSTNCSLTIQNQPSKLFLLFLKPALLEEINWKMNFPLYKPAKSNNKIQEILIQFFNNEFKPELRYFFYDNLMRELLFHIVASQDNSTTANVQLHKRALLAEEIISKDLQTHYTTQELAKMIGVNECTLKKEFKEHFQMSLFERLHFKRTERTKFLLAKTNLPIREIGMEMGYNNISAFIRAFRKLVGTTPLEWRQEYKKINRYE